LKPSAKVAGTHANDDSGSELKPSAEGAGTHADEIIAAQLSAAANTKDEQYSGDCNLAAEQRQAAAFSIPRKPRNNVAALVEKGEIAEDNVKVSFF
jgi:hypothetical protein